MKHREVGQKQSARNAKLRPGSDKSSVAVALAPLHGEEDRPTPLAADTDTLNKSEDGEKNRAPNPDLRGNLAGLRCGLARSMRLILSFLAGIILTLALLACAGFFAVKTGVVPANADGGPPPWKRGSQMFLKQMDKLPPVDAQWKEVPSAALLR
jgi:hypothetical protein